MRKLIINDETLPQDLAFPSQGAALYNGTLKGKVDTSTVKLLPENGVLDCERCNCSSKSGEKHCFSFHRCERLPKSIPGSLPHLEILSLEHWETEYGCGIEDVQGIVDAAPELRSIVGWPV